MRASIALLLACLGLGYAPSALAGADCPINYYQCNGHVFSSLASRYSIDCPPEAGTGSGAMSYDLKRGLFSSYSSGREFAGSSDITASDEFERLRPQVARWLSFV